MPIVNDLLTGNRGGDPRVFLHVLRFRDLLTRATSSQVLIRNSYPTCLACQNLRYAGHAKFSGMPGVFEVCGTPVMLISVSDML